MLYASELKKDDVVFVVRDIVLSDRLCIVRGTRAKVICVDDFRADFEIVSSNDVVLGGTIFSLYDALGRHANCNESVASVVLVFRKDGLGPGLDYEISEGNEPYPIVPVDRFVTVFGPPGIWDSADCGVDALTSFGRHVIESETRS